MDLDSEELKKRCLGRDVGRSDDNEEIIDKKLRIYNENTLPVLHKLTEKKLVYKVDSSGTIDEVFQQCCRRVDRV